MESTLSKFLDDSRLCGAGDTLEGRDAHQRDLGRLERWDHVNIIYFNKAKGKVLHLAQSKSILSIWTRETNRLRATLWTWIWGYWWTGKLYMSWQHVSVAQKVNHVLDCFKRRVASRVRVVIFPTLVRHHLENHTQGPQHQEDMDMLGSKKGHKNGLRAGVLFQ